MDFPVGVAKTADVLAAEGDGYVERNALTLEWSFGFNKNIVGGVHSLTDSHRHAVFYASAHTGIIHDMTSKKQVLLQGHCNPIVSTCVSSDKRWIVTSDTGPDSLIIVWDARKGVPVKTIFQPGFEGVIAMALSPDSHFLATLSPTIPQTLSVWAWTAEVDAPAASCDVAAKDLQTSISFNPSDQGEVVTNGEKRCIFWKWEEGEQMHFYSPGLGHMEVKNAVGDFTQSRFIPNTKQVITGTVDGDIVLWDAAHPEDGYKEGDRVAVKTIKLHHGKAPISFLHILDQSKLYPNEPLYIVVGTIDGHVRFFDLQFRLVSWFENLSTGTVTSISFVPDSAAFAGTPEVTAEFTAPDFIVATSTAIIMHVHVRTAEDPTLKSNETTLLFQGQDARVTSVAAHPLDSLVAISGHSGLVQIWDYQERAVISGRRFDGMAVECLAYSPTGTRLALGFANGAVIVVDAQSLETVWSKPLPHPRPPNYNDEGMSRFAVTHVVWAKEAQVRGSTRVLHFATADADRCAAIYTCTLTGQGGDDVSDTSQRSAAEEDREPSKETFVYVGKCRSHYKPIVGLQFGRGADGKQRLLSVGQDRRLVEYDLAASTIIGGISIMSITKLMDVPVPTAFHWHHDDFLLVPNNEYKFQMFTSDGGEKTMCRRTLLAPTYGRPLNKMVMVPNGENAPWYMAYATEEKVIGLCKLPLDGNPNKSMALIAHPGEVADISVSFDGMHVVTAGGEDGTVNFFVIEGSALEIASALGGDGVDPFAALIEGGKDGPFYEEIKNFFYYAQIRQQGEDTTRPREVHDTEISFEKVPNIMRALGYFPSQQEIENMSNEIKYSQYDITNKFVDMLDFEDLIKLYVNHRPVFPVTEEQISEAFDKLGAERVTRVLAQDRLIDALLYQGEEMSPEELQDCLHMLVGNGNYEDVLTDVSVADLMEKILQLSPADEDEEGEGEQLAQ